MWVVIFSDVRELSSAPRGGGWRKKVSWSLLSSPQCTSSKKLRFSSLSGIRPMKKRSHTTLLCVASFFRTALCLRKFGLSQLCQFCETFCIVDSHVRKDLAVHLNTSLL